MENNNETFDSQSIDVVVFKPSDGVLEYEVAIDVDADTIWAN